MIASPAPTGQRVRVSSFAAAHYVDVIPSSATAGDRNKRTTTVTTGSTIVVASAKCVA